jgi:signal transduction histidine kinase
MIEVLDIVPALRPTISVSGLQENKPEKGQSEQTPPQNLSCLALCPTANQLLLNLKSAEETNVRLGKLQEELQTLKLFGAGIAHDLGNALTVILGSLELVILSQPQLTTEQTFEELQEAVSQAKALHTQLTQLFQGTSLLMERVSLAEIIEEATRLGVFRSKVECHLKLSSKLPLLQLDRCQITQVLENLVLNAVQAMPDGGQLEVTAEPVELAEDQVQALKPGKYVEITVKDNGNGIAPEHLSMIFAPYFTTKTLGKGLGLALCYAIIKRHRGYISVKSQVGVGTTFRLWLPVNI